MAANPARPAWFANVGVQLLAGAAAVYNAVQLVLKVVDGRYGDAFLSFAWTVLFGYVLLESLRFRKLQRQEEAAAGDGPVEPSRPVEPTD
ncbi:conserved protein of unknown function [Modestobacter italicus]|uniref:Uncharacterized protein n=1 Tax=Modestobacter italicus (strain DSM 44449 / CECT 9708 / BC 501) TaxID=2732864 RepID=I4F1V1_MODI5|nr:hypothetical protein [Modestobacter marinus]CCH89614.1 conserved protein of unknown function [Modestobacter marinus]